MQEIIPVPWRVCRALNNALRLEMLRIVLMSDEPVSVDDICTAVNEKESVTSQYLRILNMQGFIVAKRRGKNVYYEIRSDAHESILNVLNAIKDSFGNPNWKKSMLRILPAFSNPRKIGVLSVLHESGPMTIDVLAQKAFMPDKTCYRIVNELSRIGLVEEGTKSTVILNMPSTTFAKAILHLGISNSHIL
jgi:DNA-binding transcriptional ArsR family regulator